METASAVATTLVTSPALDPASDRHLPVLREFVVRLTGTAPEREVLFPSSTAEIRQRTTGSEVVVVAANADTGVLDDATQRGLDVWAGEHALAGKVAFAVLIGGWPAAAGIVSDAFKTALQSGGATVVAPVLHLSDGGQESRAAAATYCGYWAPAVPALLRAAKADRSSTAA